MFLHLMKKETKAQILQENCHPLKATLTIWTQLPLWIGFSYALRNDVWNKKLRIWFIFNFPFLCGERPDNAVEDQLMAKYKGKNSLLRHNFSPSWPEKRWKEHHNRCWSLQKIYHK
ncbi:CYP315A1 [Cordylochernes scorpioides]|uniref:CYP315A1 n=1 Tax=Cordylochernes scorpioides TaxID=51811 RepID=A0ABY6L870_9ARAC|nr:CYP315A1 [Cordylochernes scorpioides]